MTKTTYENERIKREFFEQLKGARGFAKSSVITHADAINQWETFTKNEDFSAYDKSRAIGFADWINTRPSKTKSGKISLVTQSNYLRRVKKFFIWLSEQPGYKSKILKSDVDYLRLSKADAQIARSGTTKKMPTFDDVRKIIEGINGKSEIEMRDRALISFALITGARISAIISLKMKSFDKELKQIDQNPGDGVKTKNSKRILTTFFPIGWDDPEKYFMEWYEYLESKDFQSDDPIFPITEGAFVDGEHSYSKQTVGQNAWVATGAARKVFEKRCKNVSLPYFHPHSFRHLVVNILSKKRLTEEEKRAISMNLGHENVGTTFGSYGYGSMNSESAVKIVQKLKDVQEGASNSLMLSEQEKAILEKLMKRIS
ncbi:MAG: site-specific integrase [Candidatus Paceibacterota bacterium]